MHLPLATFYSLYAHKTWRLLQISFLSFMFLPYFYLRKAQFRFYSPPVFFALNHISCHFIIITIFFLNMFILPLKFSTGIILEKRPGKANFFNRAKFNFGRYGSLLLELKQSKSHYLRARLSIILRNISPVFPHNYFDC